MILHCLFNSFNCCLIQIVQVCFEKEQVILDLTHSFNFT